VQVGCLSSLVLGEFKKAQREAELGLKKFEESTTGEEALPRSKAKSKTKTEEVTIRELATYMGIDTEGKTEEVLKEEVKVKLRSSKSH
jgi:hypothetical protein